MAYDYYRTTKASTAVGITRFGEVPIWRVEKSNVVKMFLNDGHGWTASTLDREQLELMCETGTHLKISAQEAENIMNAKEKANG